MRATGIIRRVDDLGRVVIPKTIRELLNIEEDEPLEIFIDNQTRQVLFAPIEQTESIPMSDYFNTHEENYTRQELMDIVRFEQLAKKYNFSVSISDN